MCWFCPKTENKKNGGAPLSTHQICSVLAPPKAEGPPGGSKPHGVAFTAFGGVRTLRVWCVERDAPCFFFISASGQNQHMGATSIYCLSSGFSRDDGGLMSTHFSHRLALTSVGTHISWYAHRLALTSVGAHICWHAHQLARTSTGAHIGWRPHWLECDREFQGGVFHGIYPSRVCLLPVCG